MCGIEQFPKHKIPMADEYHPELDETPLCDATGITKYKSLIGSANWIITLGRFDIQYAVNTLARYSNAPRQGHMKALYQVFGYLRTTAKYQIYIYVGQPDILKNIKVTKNQNWSEMYPDAVEDIPEDMPPPKGNAVTITTFVDADHARDKLTRRSVSGVLMLVNNIPIHWVSKRQATVETSTYGSELIATRIAIDLIIELRYKLRMLGVPIKGPAKLLGDNMSVLINTTITSSPLKKKHLACSYHRVREAIAAGFVEYAHINSNQNVADIFTKPLTTQTFYELVQTYFDRKPIKEKQD